MASAERAVAAATAAVADDGYASDCSAISYGSVSSVCSVGSVEMAHLDVDEGFIVQCSRNRTKKSSVRLRDQQDGLLASAASSSKRRKAASAAASVTRLRRATDR